MPYFTCMVYLSLRIIHDAAQIMYPNPLPTISQPMEWPWAIDNTLEYWSRGHGILNDSALCAYILVWLSHEIFGGAILWWKLYYIVVEYSVGRLPLRRFWTTKIIFSSRFQVRTCLSHLLCITCPFFLKPIYMTRYNKKKHCTDIVKYINPLFPQNLDSIL